MIGIILFPLTGRAQLTDPALMKKLTVNGFCLCKTTLTDLKQSFTDLKETSVEEMDAAKSCFGQDPRYIAGKGFASVSQPGMIFQQDQGSEYISKIRLTKDFKGSLPDGKYIDMSKLVLKDLFKLYPALKDNWGSRGCSDYWHFSNDTVLFYVKIDASKKPQFPIDGAYYADKPVVGVDLVMSCYSLQKDKPMLVTEDESNDPVFFLDSIRVNRGVLQNYQPEEIAVVTVYRGADATKRVKSTTNGLIYIETKTSAREKYWRYFSSKSAGYAKIVKSPGKDNNIQYILNNEILTGNFESKLFVIDDATFKEIKIISKDQLIRDYNINDKDYGVVIISEVPAKK